MFIKGLKYLVALWLVAYWSTAAIAVPLTLPAMTSGAISSTDLTSLSRGASYYADRYEVAVTPGQQLTINLNLTGYDGYLYLYNAQGTVVASNDDFGSIYASRIVYTATAAGTLTIESTTYASSATGAYTLDVQTVGGSSASSTATSLVIPSTVTGTLGASSSRGLTQTLNPANRYSVNLQAGQTITINETAPFDTYLNLYNSASTRVAFNDDFGGTVNSQVTYTVPTSGVYTVEATSYSSAATGSYSLAISTATAAASTITASFSASPTSGAAPVNVSVWNASYSSNATDVLSYSWNFGDGTTSTLGSPTHTYSSGGNYTITLTVTNAAGQRGTSSSTVTVQAPTAQINVSFTPSVASPPANTAVTFYSTGINSSLSTFSYAWNFGDGQSSTLANPSHTFLSAGTYQVSLTMTNQAGQSATATRAITVQPLTGGLVASFRTSGTTLTTGVFESFINQSISQTIGEVLVYSWDFGDGTTSTLSDPTHAYTTGGTFVVRLTATNSLGVSSSYSQTITVQQTNSTLTAQFTASTVSGSAPLAVTFTNQSTSSLLGDSLTYSWDFGDGTTSTVASPSHTYTAAGTYSVILTVRNTSGLTQTSSATNITTSQGAVNVSGVVRLRPQAIMAGFDPILIDLTDTSFKLFCVVRPGAVPIQTVQTSTNSGGFSIAMTNAGTYSSGDQRYESTYTFARGSFPNNSVMGDLFGSATSQFRMSVMDSAQQTHSFPHVEFGNNVLMTMPITSPSAPTSTTAGIKRLLPQVLAAGVDPMLMDLGDTSFDIVAIVRAGVVPIGSVSISQNQGGFSMAMNLVETLPNGDYKYKITYTYQRGAFPDNSRMADLFGTQRGQFNIIVTDQAQQTHHFPELRVGNYPAM